MVSAVNTIRVLTVIVSFVVATTIGASVGIWIYKCTTVSAESVARSLGQLVAEFESGYEAKKEQNARPH